MIKLKTPEQIEVMREGGKILAQIHKEVSDLVMPGITTLELDREMEKRILKAGAVPVLKGYTGFPGVMCVSVNEEVVHSVPSTRVLKEGDIITLDVSIGWKGLNLDMARTLPVGEITDENAHLIATTKKALRLGIRNAKVGNTMGDIGNAVQRHVEDQGYQVVREMCGHGIGVELHEAPQVLNYGERHTGEKIEEGLVICIEPMVTVGNWKLEKDPDGHGFITEDKSLSAHFEDTVAITSQGPEVLTKIE